MEGPGLLPSTHTGWLRTVSDSSYRGSDALSWTPWAPAQEGAHTDKHTNIDTKQFKKVRVSGSRCLRKPHSH